MKSLNVTKRRQHLSKLLTKALDLPSVLRSLVFEYCDHDFIPQCTVSYNPKHNVLGVIGDDVYTTLDDVLFQNNVKLLSVPFIVTDVQKINSNWVLIQGSWQCCAIHARTHEIRHLSYAQSSCVHNGYVFYVTNGLMRWNVVKNEKAYWGPMPINGLIRIGSQICPYRMDSKSSIQTKSHNVYFV